jgi:hypothetical protein
VVNECPLALRHVYAASSLKAALTCFPAAESIKIGSPYQSLKATELEKMAEVLRAYAGSLKRVTGWWAEHVLLPAIRAGGLPKLSFYYLNLYGIAQKELMADGLLGRLPLEEVEMVVEDGDMWQLEPHDSSRCGSSRACEA